MNDLEKQLQLTKIVSTYSFYLVVLIIFILLILIVRNKKQLKPVKNIIIVGICIVIVYSLAMIIVLPILISPVYQVGK